MRGSKGLSAAVALLLVAGLAACGGGESDETSSATSAATAPAITEPDKQSTARGGEASIEDFGEEASGGERSSIEASFGGYLNALAEGDNGGACSYLSAAVQQSLEQFAAPAQKGGGCTETLPTLLAPTAPAVAREQADGEITKVRVEDDRAFVVFRAPGAELYQLTMVKEDGEWKAATVAAAVLVPEL